MLFQITDESSLRRGLTSLMRLVKYHGDVKRQCGFVGLMSESEVAPPQPSRQSQEKGGMPKSHVTGSLLIALEIYVCSALSAFKIHANTTV